MASGALIDLDGTHEVVDDIDIIIPANRGDKLLPTFGKYDDHATAVERVPHQSLHAWTGFSIKLAKLRAMQMEYRLAAEKAADFDKNRLSHQACTTGHMDMQYWPISHLSK